MLGVVPPVFFSLNNHERHFALVAFYIRFHGGQRNNGLGMLALNVTGERASFLSRADAGGFADSLVHSGRVKEYIDLTM